MLDFVMLAVGLAVLLGAAATLAYSVHIILEDRNRAD